MALHARRIAGVLLMKSNTDRRIWNTNRFSLAHDALDLDLLKLSLTVLFLSIFFMVLGARHFSLANGRRPTKLPAKHSVILSSLFVVALLVAAYQPYASIYDQLIKHHRFRLAKDGHILPARHQIPHKQTNKKRRDLKLKNEIQAI